MKIHGFGWLVIFIMAVALLCNVYMNNKNVSGFIEIPDLLFESLFSNSNQGFTRIPDGAAPAHGTVYIVITSDSSLEEGRRADKIIMALAKQKIPYEKMDSIGLNFSSDTNTFLIEKVNVALAGRAPVVIMNDWIKSSPTVDEVLKIFNSKK